MVLPARHSRRHAHPATAGQYGLRRPSGSPGIARKSFGKPITKSPKLRTGEVWATLTRPEGGDGRAEPDSSRRFRVGSYEDILAALREAYEGTALVELQPAALDRSIEPSFAFRWRSLVLVQHRPVEPLDQNAAVHIGLVSIGELDDLARG